ncbi:MAG: nitroreductase family deazaflavin-dependent oxidoreductase, partial [Acidimicrobiia bacterium]|nr:nitroreductase family deazaflavin-dependent oxidoreductase [Acidimicrobiia bacterium]
RNIMEEGGCGLDYRRQRVHLTDPQLITTEEGMAAMPPPVRAMLRALDVTEFVRLQR